MAGPDVPDSLTNMTVSWSNITVRFTGPASYDSYIIRIRNVRDGFEMSQDLPFDAKQHVFTGLQPATVHIIYLSAVISKIEETVSVRSEDISIAVYTRKYIILSYISITVYTCKYISINV